MRCREFDQRLTKSDERCRHHACPRSRQPHCDNTRKDTVNGNLFMDYLVITRSSHARSRDQHHHHRHHILQNIHHFLSLDVITIIIRSSSARIALMALATCFHNVCVCILLVAYNLARRLRLTPTTCALCVPWVLTMDTQSNYSI